MHHYKIALFTGFGIDFALVANLMGENDDVIIAPSYNEMLSSLDIFKENTSQLGTAINDLKEAFEGVTLKPLPDNKSKYISRPLRNYKAY